MTSAMIPHTNNHPNTPSAHVPREELINYALLIPTFHQIPYQTLINRVDQGSHSLSELTSILYERKELEEKQIYHFSRVSRSNLYNYEITTSSSERLLGFFKNYHLYLSKEYISFHKDFNEQIVKVLEDCKIQRTRILLKSKEQINDKLQEVTQAEQSLDRAKKNYLKAKKDLEKSLDKLLNYEKIYQETKLQEEKKKELLSLNNNTTNHVNPSGKDNSSNNNNSSTSSGGVGGGGGSGNTGSKFSNVARMFSSAFESTPEQDRDRQQKKVERRKDELNQAMQTIVEKKQKLLDLLSQLDEGFQKAATEFETIETDRMRKINSSLKKFCSLERKTLEFRLQSLAALEDAVTQQNITEDIALFIEQSKQTEFTHKYASALKLIDEYYQRYGETDEIFKKVAALSTEKMNPWITDFENNESTKGTGESGIKMEEIGRPRKSSKSLEDIAPPTSEDELIYRAGSEGRSTNEKLIEETPAVVQLNKYLDTIFSGDSQKVDRNSSSQINDVKVDQVESLEKEVQGSALAEDLWVILLESKECRDRFLQELDNQRCLTSTVSEDAYNSLRNAMKVVLDYCEINSDVRSAMRIKNMANTFHSLESDHEKIDVGSQTNTADSGSKSPTKSPSSSSKRYLYGEYPILHHPIWKLPGFWETALKEDVFQQLRQQGSISPWDELPAESLRETVISIHNMLFGQLGPLSVTMIEQGLSKSEVVHHLKLLSKKFQLTEDQEFELITNITGQSIKSYTPPPVIATVIKNKSIELSGADLPSTNIVAAEVVSVENSTGSIVGIADKIVTTKANADAETNAEKLKDVTKTNSPPVQPSKTPAINNIKPPPTEEKNPNVILKRLSRLLSSSSTQEVSGKSGNNSNNQTTPNQANAHKESKDDDDNFAVL